MADKEKEVIDEQDELVVVMTDEEGNEFYYREELIIPVGDKKFALLVGINEDEEHDCGCDCGWTLCREPVPGCGRFHNGPH